MTPETAEQLDRSLELRPVQGIYRSHPGITGHKIQKSIRSPLGKLLSAGQFECALQCALQWTGGNRPWRVAPATAV